MPLIMMWCQTPGAPRWAILAITFDYLPAQSKSIELFKGAPFLQ